VEGKVLSSADDGCVNVVGADVAKSEIKGS
jgi:hypothetical protein